MKGQFETLTGAVYFDPEDVVCVMEAVVFEAIVESQVIEHSVREVMFRGGGSITVLDNGYNMERLLG